MAERPCVLRIFFFLERQSQRRANGNLGILCGECILYMCEIYEQAFIWRNLPIFQVEGKTCDRQYQQSDRRILY